MDPRLHYQWVFLFWIYKIMWKLYCSSTAYCYHIAEGIYMPRCVMVPAWGYLGMLKDLQTVGIMLRQEKKSWCTLVHTAWEGLLVYVNNSDCAWVLCESSSWPRTTKHKIFWVQDVYVTNNFAKYVISWTFYSLPQHYGLMYSQNFSD